jgi:hypothetical protein
MPIVVANEVRRCTVSSSDLDDLGGLVRGADNSSVYVQPISYICVHANPSLFCVQHVPSLTFSEGFGAFLDRSQTFDRAVLGQASTVAGAWSTAASWLRV